MEMVERIRIAAAIAANTGPIEDLTPSRARVTSAWPAGKIASIEADRESAIIAVVRGKHEGDARGFVRRPELRLPPRKSCASASASDGNARRPIA
jgi:hypothetical protein